MKLEDLKIGDVYYNKAFGHEYIFTIKNNGELNIEYHICKHSNGGIAFIKPEDNNGFWNNTNIEKGLRFATYEESNHLKACIKAGRYVSPPEIKELELYYY